MEAAETGRRQVEDVYAYGVDGDVWIRLGSQREVEVALEGENWESPAPFKTTINSRRDIFWMMDLLAELDREEREYV